MIILVIDVIQITTLHNSKICYNHYSYHHQFVAAIITVNCLNSCSQRRHFEAFAYESERIKNRYSFILTNM